MTTPNTRTPLADDRGAVHTGGLSVSVSSSEPGSSSSVPPSRASHQLSPTCPSRFFGDTSSEPVALAGTEPAPSAASNAIGADAAAGIIERLRAAEEVTYTEIGPEQAGRWTQLW